MQTLLFLLPKIALLALGIVAMLMVQTGEAQTQTKAKSAFRPPAVPLITHDPYFSVYSTRDTLTEDWSKHWTGQTQGICGQLRIDGKPFRYMGPMPNTAPAMTQTNLEVTPTRTTYHFEAAGVRLGLTFLTPLLSDDLEVLARPLTYLSWNVEAIDGKKHDVSIYFDITGEWVVDKPSQSVTWGRFKAGKLELTRFGSQEQKILNRAGDDLRIDWGYLYVATPADVKNQSVIESDRSCRFGFADTGKLPDTDDLRSPRPASDNWPVSAHVFELGQVGSEPISRRAMLAYDEIFSIELMNQRLKPYWKRNGAEITDLIHTADKEYPSLVERCKKFDEEIFHDLTQAGGEQYAQIAALSYRQCHAAHTYAADWQGNLLSFSKENFSNGCISTIDVIYPCSPFFLLFNPALLKAHLTPVLDYATSKRWRFPFAPHDLGTYPLANGQVYGGGERDETNQMPVEESGNFLIMLGALAKIEGNADYSKQYWGELTKWAEYLKEKGLDPDNQLCTDDFAGHLAHNTNLSLKAIIGIGSYAYLAELAGHKEDAALYRKTAEGMAKKWVEMAKDGDHFRLTFDKPGTWSQKYNLVWDKLLGLNLFPADIAKSEVTYYKSKLNPFGLPLDNRSAYTKLDWVVWTATLADNKADFEAIANPIYRFANETPSRVPLSDWYWTTDGKQTGFQARSVVGGVFIKLLEDKTIWKKWAERAKSAKQTQ